MSSEKILSVAVPRPLEGLFTYRLPESLASEIEIGGWVRVPFGRTTTHAYVVESHKPLEELPEHLSVDTLKEIIEVGSKEKVLPEDVVRLCKWAQEYYQAPIGEVFNCAAPSAALGLRNKKESRHVEIKSFEPTVLPLTNDQKNAIETLESQRGSKEFPNVALLHGVTGSGKTEIYLELARRTLKEGRSVLVLVPEIALTPQLHERFEKGLGTTVGLWHSAISDGKRRDLFTALLDGKVRVVVGARSAIFAPLKNLGLIVVDEEHDTSYKQEERFRYNARDLAVVRSKISKAFTLLGSATPSLETRERVREGRYKLAELPKRISGGSLPLIETVNLCEEELVPKTQAPFAKKTIEAIQCTIDSGEQVMVFLNRRGFAAFLVCEDCGEVAGCADCSVSLTVHRRSRLLVCHTCGYQELIPRQCPHCRSLELKPVGAGTESLEEELPKLIPGLKPIRLDRDQITSATRLGKALESFRKGEANGMFGTQMLVKGHDFPGVTLVVVVLADALFRWPDFKAVERAFQILTQVSGRAGRASKDGRVLIQTFSPDHPVLQAVRGELSENELLESERMLRKELKYPPFSRLARLRFEGNSRDEAKRNATGVVQQLEAYQKQNMLSESEILGPSEALLEKLKGVYRWDILIKSAQIQDLQRLVWVAKSLASQHRLALIVDIDPSGTN